MKLTEIPVEGYEKVVRCDDPAHHLKAFIAVHDTTLGPALGGVRMWPYRSDQEAFTDVTRLARGMTYKSAVADTGLGGGKAVIIGEPQGEKSEPLLRAMGRFVDTFDGQYIAAEDVGMTEDDLVIMRQETRHVAGLPRAYNAGGNPAQFTAFGVFLGMRVCLERALQTDRFTDVRVGVQGCGSVAQDLCQQLHDAGAMLVLTDVDSRKAHALAERVGASVVAPDEIYRVPCEIYAPCALGGILNDLTLPQLSCTIVAGCANNQCLRPEHAERLHERGILYAPDFVINAGGIINIAVEREPQGYDEARALARVRHISTVLHDIFDLAAHAQITTERAAMVFAERKLQAGRENPGEGSHADPIHSPDYSG